MIRVVKLGGRPQEDPRLASIIAEAWRAAPGTLCIVHGGGGEISMLQRTLGVEPVFVGGRRVTRECDVDVIRMALSGTANKRLVARLVSAGIPALGLSGEDAALIEASAVDPASLGRVGAPGRVNGALLRLLLQGGYLPVISPLSRDSGTADGAALNVNGDDAAAAIAAELAADELVLVADVPGVLIGGEAVPVLDPEEAAAAIAQGIARGGMAAKLEAAIAALRRGVERVRIGALDAILDSGRGTLLAASRSLV